MSESAGNRLSRLLALVPWLLAHDGITVNEAAAHFGVSSEELEKDLWLLVVSGLPGYGPDQLVDIDFWDDGVIHVLDAQTLTEPLRLTHDEACTLLIALHTVAQVPGVGDRTAITSAAAKIERSLDGALTSGALPTIDVAVESEVRTAIDHALAESGSLAITYANGTGGEITSRVILPRTVTVIDGVGYLEAWCTMAQAYRTFRLDRILQAQPVGATSGSTGDGAEGVTIEPEQSGDDDERPDSLSALLAVESTHRWIADVHRSAQAQGEDPSGRLLVRIPLHSLTWGVSLVLSLGGRAEALEPPALVTAVARAAADALATYPDHVG